MLIKELRVSLNSPPVLWCDNASALALASNPVFHSRTKHIKVNYHFVREKVVNRDISVKFISSLDQIADIFTKGHAITRFAQQMIKHLVCPPPYACRGMLEPPIIKQQI